VFAEACEQFQALLEQLEGEDTAELEHGEVEALLETQGRELLRRLLQGHLDRRASGERRWDAIVGSDGVVRPHHRRDCRRQLETLFGRVQVRRPGYSARGHGSLYPLDAALNLPPDAYSDGLRRRVAEEVAKVSFEEAVGGVEQTTGGHVPKRQGEALAVKVSQDFEAFYGTRQAQEAEVSDDLLVMSVDGKGIVMHAQDLREATRKAAQRAAATPRKARLSPGEKRNRKRLATVAAIYPVAPYRRSAEQVMDIAHDSTPTSPRPAVRHKRVWASVARPAEAVIAELFAEARRRDPAQSRPWVVLIDGEETQLARIEAQLKRQPRPVTVVLDWVHVLEYLWKAAYEFHPAGSQAAEDWVQERALKLLQGRASEVAAGMRRSATLRALVAPCRQAVDKCADYLLKYRRYLNYDAYLAQGFPIATGVIEGACRHVVKDRMDLTGARWRLQSAEAVLKLRSLRSSGDFDEYWVFHKAQELQRNHLSQYADVPLLEAA
jgi:hypothetical protein